MTVVIGILALIGLAVVGACAWAFAQGGARWAGSLAGGTARWSESAAALGRTAALAVCNAAEQLPSGSAGR